MTNYNKLSEEEQIKIVRENGWLIIYIDNPSEAVKLASVKKNGHAIRYIKKPSEEIQISAVQKNIDTIQYIRNPSVSVIKYCLYECDITDNILLKTLYKKLTSDEDKVYFNMKYGGIVND